MIEQMFPNNRLPSEPDKPASSLLYSNYDTVAIREYKMARNMVAREREVQWLSDGRMIDTILYDVYPFPSVNDTPCLSVYGGKMVQNWLQLDSYKAYREPNYSQEIKENNNVGFNYTGL